MKNFVIHKVDAVGYRSQCGLEGGARLSGRATEWEDCTCKNCLRSLRRRERFNAGIYAEGLKAIGVGREAVTA